MSENIDPCFTNVFGLARTVGDCLSDGMPTNATDSDSGIFLFDLNGLNINFVRAIQDANRGNLWEISQLAKENGIRDTIEALMRYIVANTSLIRQPYRGYLGEWEKAGSYVSAMKLFHGLRLRMANVSGGYVKIHKIGLAFNQADTFDVNIYDNQSDDILHTVQIVTEANKLTWKTLDAPIELSLAAPFGSHNPLEYYFLYDTRANLKYKDTKTTCGCGGGFHPSWNLQNPQYMSNEAKPVKYGWAEFCIAAGIGGDDITKAANWPTETLTHGMLLDVEFGCRGVKTICNGTLDFYQEIPSALAYTMRLAAGINLCRTFISSSEINRYTLSAKEQIAAEAQTYIDEFNQRIVWLGTEMVRQQYLNNNSDCFTCRDDEAMVLRSVLK